MSQATTTSPADSKQDHLTKAKDWLHAQIDEGSGTDGYWSDALTGAALGLTGAPSALLVGWLTADIFNPHLLSNNVEADYTNLGEAIINAIFDIGNSSGSPTYPAPGSPSTDKTQAITDLKTWIDTKVDNAADLVWNDHIKGAIDGLSRSDTPRLDHTNAPPLFYGWLANGMTGDGSSSSSTSQMQAIGVIANQIVEYDQAEVIFAAPSNVDTNGDIDFVYQIPEYESGTEAESVFACVWIASLEHGSSSYTPSDSDRTVLISTATQSPCRGYIAGSALSNYSHKHIGFLIAAYSSDTGNALLGSTFKVYSKDDLTYQQDGNLSGTVPAWPSS